MSDEQRQYNYLDLINQKNGFDNKSKRVSMVEGLLHEIYDRCHQSRSQPDSSVDSDTLTEPSISENCYFSRKCENGTNFHQQAEQVLWKMGVPELRQLRKEMNLKVASVSSKLVKQLKRREHRSHKLQKKQDVLTAFLQASSLKRKEDMNLRFTMEPKPGEESFQQWLDAMRAVSRLPTGFPADFRRKVWLVLANHYIEQQCYNWSTIQSQAFHEHSTAGDLSLDAQIVKDLHRTGCDRFCSESDRASLRRVLLAYARWNKRVGYCQGFNVLAALILEVVDRREEEALKVMVYLVDHVLPDRYFAQNLQALSVDMAVFRDLLHIHGPTLATHLDTLQQKAIETNVSLSSNRSYEPPLTNVFTMQWFLTLFATCLPEDAVIRVWDLVMLEGSEVMLRTALVIWDVLSSHIMKATSADNFYGLMRDLTERMSLGELISQDELIQCIYTISSFPYQLIHDLRERYTYNITPFASANRMTAAAETIAVAAAKTGTRGALKQQKSKSSSTSELDEVEEEEEEEENDEEDSYASDEDNTHGCLSGLLHVRSKSVHGTSLRSQTASRAADISAVGPGAVSSYHPDENDRSRRRKGLSFNSMCQERMSTNLSALQTQYHRLRNRQRQAAVIVSRAIAGTQRIEPAQNLKWLYGVPCNDAINHLFLVHPSQAIETVNFTPNPGYLPKCPSACLNTTHTPSEFSIPTTDAQKKSSQISPHHLAACYTDDVERGSQEVYYQGGGLIKNGDDHRGQRDMFERHGKTMVTVRNIMYSCAEHHHLQAGKFAHSLQQLPFTDDGLGKHYFSETNNLVKRETESQATSDSQATSCEGVNIRLPKLDHKHDPTAKWVEQLHVEHAEQDVLKLGTTDRPTSLRDSATLSTTASSCSIPIDIASVPKDPKEENISDPSGKMEPQSISPQLQRLSALSCTDSQSNQYSWKYISQTVSKDKQPPYYGFLAPSSVSSKFRHQVNGVSSPLRCNLLNANRVKFGSKFGLYNNQMIKDNKEKTDQ